jgi:hypothetical protein
LRDLRNRQISGNRVQPSQLPKRQHPRF